MSGTYTPPVVRQGQVWTVAQWNSFFASLGQLVPTPVADDVQSTVTATTTCVVSPISTSCLITMGTTDTVISVSDGSRNGQTLRLEINQGATPHLVSFDASVTFGSDITGFVASTVANKRDLVQLIWNGARWMFLAAVHGY